MFFKTLSLVHYLADLTLSNNTTVVRQFMVVSSSYGSLPAWADRRTLLSDPSSCPHCMVVLGPASESATFVSSYSFNQQFSPHGQPQPATSCTLMSQESQTRPSCSSHCSFLSSFTHHIRVGVHTAKLQPMKRSIPHD